MDLDSEVSEYLGSGYVMFNSSCKWNLHVPHLQVSCSDSLDTLRPSDAYMHNELTIIGSDNGLSPFRHQAIISTNAGILLIGPLGTNCSEILIYFNVFSFKKMHLKLSSANWQPFNLGLNMLKKIRHQNNSSSKWHIPFICCLLQSPVNWLFWPNLENRKSVKGINSMLWFITTLRSESFIHWCLCQWYYLSRVWSQNKFGFIVF